MNSNDEKNISETPKPNNESNDMKNSELDDYNPDEKILKKNKIKNKKMMMNQKEIFLNQILIKEILVNNQGLMNQIIQQKQK